jgi:hypothetical protein
MRHKRELHVERRKQFTAIQLAYLIPTGSDTRGACRFHTAYPERQGAVQSGVRGRERAAYGEVGSTESANPANAAKACALRTLPAMLNPVKPANPTQPTFY